MTRYWIAASRPFENAKAPTGSIESPNCSNRIRSVIEVIALTSADASRLV